MLEHVLIEIFPGTPVNVLKEIELFLSKREVYSRTDVLALNTNELLSDGLLSEAEITKIERFIEKNDPKQFDKIIKEREMQKFDPRILKHVLAQIFIGTSADRLSDIEHILNDEEVFSGEDILVLNTNKLKKQGSFSEVELSKFEEYIKENPEKFDLLLIEIFGGISCDRLEEIKIHLNKLEIDNRGDLLTLSVSILKDVFFSQVEKNKLEKFLELNSDKLENTLRKIFQGTSLDRLKEIQKFLNKQEVYTGNHILIVRPNKLKKDGFLSEQELSKIEYYIKEGNKEKYDDMKETRKSKEKKNMMKYESSLRMTEKHHQSLLEEKNMLSSSISDLTKCFTQLTDSVTEITDKQSFFWVKTSEVTTVTRSQKPAFEGDNQKLVMDLLQEDRARLKAIDQELKQFAAIKLNLPRDPGTMALKEP